MPDPILPPDVIRTNIWETWQSQMDQLENEYSILESYKKQPKANDYIYNSRLNALDQRNKHLQNMAYWINQLCKSEEAAFNRGLAQAHNKKQKEISREEAHLLQLQKWADHF